MSKYRKDRINDAVTEELAVAVRELVDPRLSDNLTSVTRAEVSPDLKIAKVYYSSISGGEDVDRALRGAAGALRPALATRLNLRITPELIFVRDDAMEHGQRIAELLRQIRPQTGGHGEEDEP